VTTRRFVKVFCPRRILVVPYEWSSREKKPMDVSLKSLSTMSVFGVVLTRRAAALPALENALPSERCRKCGEPRNSGQ
jgi:hypothetical protein